MCMVTEWFIQNVQLSTVDIESWSKYMGAYFPIPPDDGQWNYREEVCLQWYCQQVTRYDSCSGNAIIVDPVRELVYLHEYCTLLTSVLLTSVNRVKLLLLLCDHVIANTSLSLFFSCRYEHSQKMTPLRFLSGVSLFFSTSPTSLHLSLPQLIWCQPHLMKET